MAADQQQPLHWMSTQNGHHDIINYSMSLRLAILMLLRSYAERAKLLAALRLAVAIRGNTNVTT